MYGHASSDLEFHGGAQHSWPWWSLHIEVGPSPSTRSPQNAGPRTLQPWTLHLPASEPAYPQYYGPIWIVWLMMTVGRDEMTIRRWRIWREAVRVKACSMGFQKFALREEGFQLRTRRGWYWLMRCIVRAGKVGGNIRWSDRISLPNTMPFVIDITNYRANRWLVLELSLVNRLSCRHISRLNRSNFI